MGLFTSRHGIIVSCDITSLSLLEEIVEQTCDLPFIQGYKIGMSLVVPFGIKIVIKRIQTLTALPIIYDHQKFGTDIPDICGGEILSILKSAGISAIISFPQSGIKTLQSVVEGCQRTGLTCIIGGEMTHKGYLVKEEGYIADDAPRRIYLDAAKLGVEHFVIPGTKLESISTYRREIEKVVKEPKFLFPGIGKGQGGDIVAAFSRVSPFESYAIVGRSIYSEKDKRAAAERIWANVSAFLSRA